MKNAETDEVQHVRPETVLVEMKKIGAPQATLAELVGISEATLSLWLSGKRGLNIEAQRDVLNALAFMSWVKTSSQFPVDFSNAAALFPHWNKFLRDKKRSA